MGLWTKNNLREFIKENKLVAQDRAKCFERPIRRNDSGNAGGRDGYASRSRET